MQVDLKVSQLLSSRLCHDLVGPIGAVNSGLELLEEGFDEGSGEGSGEDGRALALVANSAVEATRRLAFFRIAFGLGAGTKGQATLNEAGALASGYLEGGKVALDWPQDGPVGRPDPVKPNVVKVVLNMVLMAAESLPRGGKIGVSFGDLDEGLGVGLTAEGEGGALRGDIMEALEHGAKEAVKGDGENDEGAGDTLSARNVHGYFAQCLARELDGLIEHSVGENGEIRLAVLFPNATD